VVPLRPVPADTLNLARRTVRSGLTEIWAVGVAEGRVLARTAGRWRSPTMSGRRTPGVWCPTHRFGKTLIPFRSREMARTLIRYGAKICRSSATLLPLIA
jgi:hypothetical protein